MSKFHGRFFWYELMTTDTEAAKAFYSRVVGWTTRNAGPEYGGYTVLEQGPVGVAGIMAKPAGMADSPSVWLGYIGVDDVDETANKLEQAGGKIMRPPHDIPGIGRFCPVTDPQGGGFLIMKPIPRPDMPEAGPQTGPGFAAWRELLAGNWEEAFAFYSGLFGWTKGAAVDLGAMGTYQLFDHDGETIGGMMTKPPEVPRPFWSYYFRVDSVKAAAERVKAAGGTLLHEPMEVPTGGTWIIQGADPQGAMFSLLSPNP